MPRQQLHLHPYHLSLKKRMFDVGVATALLTLLLPVLATVSLLVFFTSGRPIFFVQKRQGFGKKPFQMIKFRTMRPHSQKEKTQLQSLNEAPWPMFKHTHDPRFTLLGKMLSRTGLDELPQLWHVIQGKMSLIGPRPLPIEEAAQLPTHWNFRYFVRPGILSQWAIAPDRYQSLRRWKQLEMDGLRYTRIRDEVLLIARAGVYLIESNLRALGSRAPILHQRRAIYPRRTRPIVSRKDATIG